MGPLPLPEGVVFSQALSDRVFAETGVRATYRSRPQWGSGKYLYLSGPAPATNLDSALTLIIFYGTAVGGGGEGGGPM